MDGAAFPSGAMTAAIPASTSPTLSSPEEFAVEEDHDMLSGPWHDNHDSTSPSTTQARPIQLPKRRRVTRACDECRRKKIKCDGKQPCTHCTVYSYDCTYDQPSNRRRNPAPHFIEALERRAQRAEALLRMLVPNIDLNNPNLENAIQHGRFDGNARALPHNGRTVTGGPSTAQDSDADPQLSSMIGSTGKLNLDESNHWDFRGSSSGTMFIQGMQNRLGGLLKIEHDAPMLPKMPEQPPPMFGSPRSSMDSPHETGLPNTVDLPSREIAKNLCDHALESACALLRLIHQPSFYQMLDRIYDVPVETFGDEENKFLPLLYVVLALGCMFHPDLADNPAGTAGQSYQSKIEQGYKYFRAARQMIDVTDCRDMVSLQAIVFMILFLQSSANLSTCYAYIGVALRSSLRMGLHRNLAGQFNLIERETRRRVFWVVRKMDTYVSALLGFPLMLSVDDIDQELPVEIDDEYITNESILPMPAGKTSLYAASNAHTRLLDILNKVIKYIYPTKGLEQSVQGSTTSSYVISHTKIREIERDLADWLDNLPMALRPGGDGSLQVARVQQLLRLSYAHVQMMLYRPFLHYSSQKSCAGKIVDERSYAAAAAGVSVSRNIIHICSEMKRRGLLIGAYWFTMYTTFFAILSLVFFVLENPDKQGSQEILADAYDGKDTLLSLAKRSQAADRCSVALRGLFEKLPDKLKNNDIAPVSGKKKRSAPSSSQQAVRSNPDLTQTEHVPAKGIARAATFPTPTSVPITKQASAAFDESGFPNNAISNPNPRQSFLGTVPLTGVSTAVSTPDSSNTGSSMQPQYDLQQQYGVNTALPDLSAMMFPSADPFAYPNQPMMGFDNIKQENIGGNMMNGQAQFNNFAPSSGVYDDLEGQLFGPIPPYLHQGQANFNASTQMGEALNQQDMNFYPGYLSNIPNEFAGIFFGNGSDNWESTMADANLDQRYQ